MDQEPLSRESFKQHTVFMVYFLKKINIWGWAGLAPQYARKNFQTFFSPQNEN
jgi:hypothetical protein